MEKVNCTFQKKIGSTLYKVNMYFKNAIHETLDDKILQLTKNYKNTKILLVFIKYISYNKNSNSLY